MADDEKRNLIKQRAEAEYQKWKSTLASSDRKELQATERLKATGSGNLEDAENLLASGYRKVDGKHVAPDLLVSRGGLRRVVRGGDGRPDWDGDEVLLPDLARAVLSGREAQVFDQYVVAPLTKDAPQPTVEEMAAQHGVSTRQIYKYIEAGMQKVRAAWAEVLETGDMAKIFSAASSKTT